MEKYGSRIGCLVEEDHKPWPSLAASWWKDLMSLENVIGVDWFNREVARKIGNVGETRIFGMMLGGVPFH